MRKRFLPRQVSSISLSSLLALGILRCVGDKITLASLLQDCKTFIFKCSRSTVAILQCCIHHPIQKVLTMTQSKQTGWMIPPTCGGILTQDADFFPPSFFCQSIKDTLPFYSLWQSLLHRFWIESCRAVQKQQGAGKGSKMGWSWA